MSYHRIMLEQDGQTRGLEDWATLRGIAAATLYKRIKRGWSAEKTLTTPLQPQPAGWKPRGEKMRCPPLPAGDG